jgi:hypothetical protein
MEQLRKIACKGSHTALHRTCEASIVMLQMLGQ